MSGSPQHFTDADALADAIIERIGREIVLGLPLGLGKAPHIANALYARAARDPSISLRVFTALTLEAPVPGSEIERRFLEPVIERTMGGYPRLSYAEAQRKDELPPNVEVNEFFFQAGGRLGKADAQQSYISANYTHAARYLADRGVNVIAQLVAARGEGAAERYSLSCNTDLTCDLLAMRDAGKLDFVLAGQANAELPFMAGEAEQDGAGFAFMLDETEFPLFGPPKRPVAAVDHAIGVHVAALVPDGGTLQIGIGELGDAAAHGLILRHRDPGAFASALSRLDGPLSPRLERHMRPFETGLYAASEMVVDSFLDLIREGVVRREVDGALIHGGFFLGPRAFYAALRDMEEDKRAKIAMRGISYVNALYGDEEAKRDARVDARFVNSAMIVTLMGAVVSDQLDDGQVVSGVGGQHDFVTQAFALDGARAVITLRATRMHDGEPRSNIVWNYAHTTIPRHLRDVVVTEYGAADLRGASDAQVIERLLGVADSRFQDELLDQAKAAGKIAPGYAIPDERRRNLPDRIEAAISRADFPAFPFGTDFTPAEQRLIPALERLRQAQHRKRDLLTLIRQGVSSDDLDEAELAALDRMGFAEGGGLKDRALAALLRGALIASRTEPARA